VNFISHGFMRVLRHEELVLTHVPGLIGLLPVPRGALLSAPTIDAIGDLKRLSKSQKLLLIYGIDIQYSISIL